MSSVAFIYDANGRPTSYYLPLDNPETPASLWSRGTGPNTVAIGDHSHNVAGRWLKPHQSGIADTSETFVVGRVMAAMFDIPVTAMLDGVAYVVGATAAGNVRVGIYGPLASRTTDTCEAAPLLVESASTAQDGINTPQLITFTATLAEAGVYYAALEGSDVTGTYMRLIDQSQAPGVLTAYYDRAGGYGALTNPCPAVTESGTSVPGLRVRVAV